MGNRYQPKFWFEDLCAAASGSLRLIQAAFQDQFVPHDSFGASQITGGRECGATLGVPTDYQEKIMDLLGVKL